MPYNSRGDICRLLSERNDTKLRGFRSQLEPSYESNHTEELVYNETVCLCMTIYIYIYICVCVCLLSIILVYKIALLLFIRMVCFQVIYICTYEYVCECVHGN